MEEPIDIKRKHLVFNFWTLRDKEYLDIKGTYKPFDFYRTNKKRKLYLVKNIVHIMQLEV